MRLGGWFLVFGVVVLAGCQSLSIATKKRPEPALLPAPLPASASPTVHAVQAFACDQPQASCHKGRFGLVWRQRLAEGEEQSEVVSGVYEWEAGFKPQPAQTGWPVLQGQAEQPQAALLPYARLSLRTSLGPALGELQQLGPVYQARLADGQVVLAGSWQELFSQIFVADLPVEPLLAWLHSPKASAPPNLPPAWQWQAQGGRYRLQQQTDSLFARVDFIVQP